MGQAIALGVSFFCGVLLLVASLVVLLAFSRLPALRFWAGSWALAGLGCSLVGLLPPGPEFPPYPTFLVTFFVLGSPLLMALGYLTWFGLSPAQGRGALARTALWGGTALALLPAALGVTSRDPLAWALVAAWSLVPVVFSVVLLVVYGWRDHRPSVRAQSVSLFHALVGGLLPYLLSWILYPLFPTWGWPWGLVPFLVLGAGLTLRSLFYFDTRFHPHHSAPFLMEKTQDPVVFLQANGRIQAVNPAFVALIDEEEAALVGRATAELAADTDSRRLLVPLESLTFPDWEGTLALAHRSGTPIPVHLVYRRVHNPAREAVGAVVLVHDLRIPHRLDLTTREDSLTSLSNRRWVLELLEAEMIRSQRYGSPLSVLWVEVDQWDLLVTRAGQAGANEVLRRIAAIQRGGLRKTDFCGRVGTEEFLVVLPETPQDRAGVVATRLENLYALTDEEEGSAGLRIGVTSLDESMATTDDFLARVRAAVPAAHPR